MHQLRDVTEQNPHREPQLLMELKGIGQVGASIVLCEVQMVWDEVFPFADARVFETARALHLPNDGNHLRQLVGDAACG